MSTPKYRHLSSDELQQLEKEFIEFLIVNGITGEDWEKIKATTPADAEAILVQFSDVVFEGVFRKVKYMDVVEQQSIKTFQCLEDKIVLVGLDVSNPNIDFTNPNILKDVLQGKLEGAHIYTTDKTYQPERGLELFRMQTAGAQISEGSLFKSLSLALADQNG